MKYSKIVWCVGLTSAVNHNYPNEKQKKYLKYFSVNVMSMTMLSSSGTAIKVIKNVCT